jgi:hypothetical protein
LTFVFFVVALFAMLGTSFFNADTHAPQSGAPRGMKMVLE